MSYVDFRAIGLQRFPTSLYMWGDNTNGLLGDSGAPTYFSWSKIASGGLHTVAIRNDGTLWGWGYNLTGQLGTSDTVNRSSPTQIGTSIWTQVSTGLSHTIAIKSDSTIWSWGRNNYGQLGNSSTVNRSSPIQVGTSSWTVISAGGNHTIGVKVDNTLYAWGFNGSGQLGDISISSRSSPVIVGTASGLTNSNAYSLVFDGTTQYLSVANSGTTLDFSTNDFTVEFWVYATSAVSAQTSAFSYSNYGDNIGHFGINGNTGKLALSYSNSGTINTYTYGPTWVLNTWYHVAIVRISSVATLYVNGTSYGNSNLGSRDFSNVPGLFIGVSDGSSGSWAAGGNNFPGYISNLRIVKGVGVYTGNFTTPTSPLTTTQNADTNISAITAGQTILLTCQNTSIIDNSTSAFSITNNASVVYTFATPFTSAIPSGAFFVASISAGKTHTVALTTDNKLYAWGDNTYGELGDSTTINRSSPVQIGTSSWSQVSAGGTHTAGVESDGSLLTWGLNSSGQLGLDATYSGYYWAQVSKGLSHTLAIRNDGALFVWGQNQYGQLGTTDTVNRSSPMQLGTSSWTSIDAGGSHSVAIRTDGKLFTWGANDWGQLGNNPTQYNITWSKIVTSSSGTHTLAIKNDGTLWGWGLQGGEGRIGDGTTTSKSSPTQVGLLNTWIDIAAGSAHSMGITNDSVLYTWGSGTFGQLGDGTAISKTSPIAVGSGIIFTKVFAGYQTSIAIDNNNYGYIWGDNTWGLIPGSIVGVHRSSIALINNIDTWSSFAVDLHVLGIKTNGTLWGWGRNATGQLGLGDLINRSSPTQVGVAYSVPSWTQISAGVSFSVGITTANLVYAWGLNSSGQLGLNDTVSRVGPVGVGMAAGLTNVIAGDAHVLVLNSAGNLYTWGLNNAGQLGSATTITRSSPVQVGTEIYNKISAGTSYSLGIRSADNSFQLWGLNSSGQLGNGTTINRSSPVQIGTTTANYSSPVQIGTSSWSQISAGEGHTLGIGSDGSMYGWGKNDQGQLGIENTWVYLTGGASSGAGIRGDRKLYVWGQNGNQQVLGLGDTSARSSPVQLTASGGTVTDFSYTIMGTAGFRAAIATDGTLWGWGDNSKGQLGLGDTVNRSLPVQIGALSNWTTLGAGWYQLYAINSLGQLWASGDNGSQGVGFLGDNSTISRSSPIQIGSDTNWSNISGGSSHTAAIKTNGTLYIWGFNTVGQLGLNDVITRSSPVQIPGSWSMVSSNSSHTVALTSTNLLYAWGTNTHGQLGLTNINAAGDSIARSSPVQIGTSSWTMIATGNTASAGIKLDKTLWTWGLNINGMLGINFTAANTIGRSSPVQVGTSSWSTIAGGNFGIHFYGLLSGDSANLYTWGYNFSGELGTGDTLNRSSPVQLSGRAGPTPAALFPIKVGSSSWTSISAGGTHSVAIRSDSTLWSWGLNSLGQLGLNDTVARSSPVQIGTSSWIQVSAGEDHNGGVKLDGTLFLWGLNTRGQLGVSDTLNRSSPVQVAGYWNEVEAGSSHTVGLADNNTLYIWGDDNFGQ